MKILMIVANPNPGSFGNAIAEKTRSTLSSMGHETVFHDLYAEGFDPLLPAGEIPKDSPLPPAINRHCDELAQSDGIVIVHPNWWGQPPAILKGWVDRVVRQGVAYAFKVNDSGEGVPVGLLKARSAVVFTTSNTPDEREMAVFGDPLENLWKNCIFSFCGVTKFRRRNFSVMVVSTPDERKKWLDEAAQLVKEAFPANS